MRGRKTDNIKPHVTETGWKGADCILEDCVDCMGANAGRNGT